MPQPSQRPAFALIAACLLLASCSHWSAPPSAQEQAKAIADAVSSGGYQAVRRHPTEQLTDRWFYNGQTIAVSLLAPSTPGRYPLIVYLPGLGESAEAGDRWREDWAQAGYAVFSLQAETLAHALNELPATEHGDKDGEFDEEMDDARRAALAARASDLRYIGHQYFAQPALAERIEQTLWALAQFKQRSLSGQDLFGRADTSQMVVAGYELGAQTVAALIGEKTGIELPSRHDFSPQAAILISPTVDPAQGAVHSRFQALSLPLLAISSEFDDDPYGISSPQVRKAVWEFAPAGHKWWLRVRHANHRQLAGTQRLPVGVDRQADDSNGFFPDKLWPDFGMRFSGNHRARGQAGDAMGEWHRGGERSAVETVKALASIQSVSGAFLDSMVKKDALADDWLNRKAAGWLRKTAELQGK